ncbi:MAG: hypothetical protein M0T72_06920 [Candidatus Dormibacteraeota bacterium]|nr:hypothetical protein [Candidatus Dormibacteraeota bacterium]
MAWGAPAGIAVASRAGWPDGSLGDRFASSVLLKAAKAPRLRDASVPDASTIASDPTQWAVAIEVLIRSVVLDGLAPDDPQVRDLCEVMRPLAEAELADAQAADAEAVEDGFLRLARVPGFEDDDGPVFLLGCCALVDAVWTLSGDDPLEPVLKVLARRLAVARLGVDGRLVAEAAVCAFSEHHLCELPGDAELLARLGPSRSENPLTDLVLDGVIEPGQALRLGLVVLHALAGLCLSEKMSVLAGAAS